MKIMYSTREVGKMIEMGDKIIELINTKYPEYADEVKGKTGLDLLTQYETKLPFVTCTVDANGYTMEVKEGFVVDILDIYSNTFVKGLPLLIKIGKLIDPLVSVVQDAVDGFKSVIAKWTFQEAKTITPSNFSCEDDRSKACDSICHECPVFQDWLKDNRPIYEAPSIEDNGMMQRPPF